MVYRYFKRPNVLSKNVFTFVFFIQIPSQRHSLSFRALQNIGITLLSIKGGGYIVYCGNKWLELFN